MSTTEMELLDAPVEVKADEEKGKGFFAALVSVFGNKDRNGDRVLPGAFAKTIERWKQAGNPIPVIHGHQHGDPLSFIGSVDPNDVRETKDGLVVAGKLDIEGNPRAAEIFALLKKGLINSWSFAFEARDYDLVDGVRELKELDLFEVGPVLIGANDQARTLALKEAGAIETKSPPWHIEERDEGFCVILDEDGSTVKCHPTKAEASAHMAALYANATSADPEIKEPAASEVIAAMVSDLEDKRGRRISKATAEKLTAIRNAVNELLEDIEKADDSIGGAGAVAPVAKADLARQELAGVSVFLSERGVG